ncbi:MAG: ABC transporter permease [Mariniblastus sp.]|nr:ABC transporter permease [Mariniblastus sp.]
MTSSLRIAISSLRHYWRSDAVIAVGVGIATAVLTGALIVGDSMRGSLQELTLDRLGRIDEMFVSDGFFRQALAVELSETDVFQKDYQTAVPAILFPNGSVEFIREQETQRASQVMVMGVVPEFWGLGDPVMAPPARLSGRQAAINSTLAEGLGITQQDVDEGSALVTVRVPKPNQLPADSTMAKTKDLVFSLVELPVVSIVPTKGLGRFGLHPTQSNPANIYLSIDLITDELSRGVLSHKADAAQCNAILIAAKNSRLPPKSSVSQSLQMALRPTLGDMGLELKSVKLAFDQGGATETIYDYVSLSSDRMVLPKVVADSVLKINQSSQPVFTYLANDLALAEQTQGVPFSMVAAIDFGDQFHLETPQGKPIATPALDEIVLNQWAADDLGAQLGDKIRLTYFEPETRYGEQQEQQVELKLSAIAKLTEPSQPPRYRRRGGLTPAVFDRPPTMANDPDLTPQVAGVTDAASIEKWDLPFETADRIRAQDDDYWTFYRTTPKAFVNLELGRKLWGSRFGQTTSIRIPMTDVSEAGLSRIITEQLAQDQPSFGFELISIKRNGLQASSGSTPFDALFLALSMFVIGAALILVSLLFRLALTQRSNEIGVMLATGFQARKVIGIWLLEMSLVSIMGALLGTGFGLGYAAFMIHGLKTWWVGAISRPFLNLYVTPGSLVIGLTIGIAICVLTIFWSIRGAGKRTVRLLLSGVGIDSESRPSHLGRSVATKVAMGCLVAAMGLAVLATQLGGEPQAGAFMGAGFLVLAFCLIMTRNWLRVDRPANSRLSLLNLAVLSAQRAPLRSTLTIGLVAVASFLILAVSSFRLTPTEQGTAGFSSVGRSNEPVFTNLNTAKGLNEVLGDLKVRPGSEIFSLRFKSGEDASCNNLYQSTQPQVLGIPQALIRRFDDTSNESFMWAASLAQTAAERANPWELLNGPIEDGAIPVIIDKNTANYSLKIFAPGGEYTVHYDSGETLTFRVVGFLANSVLQGNLIVSEENFIRAFPRIGGYRYFLIKDAPRVTEDLPSGSPNWLTVEEALERSLSDIGFDARSATGLLLDFMQVQNTYINTFQTLGALGLLLGTFGLAAVQIRSVLERRSELGLLQAVGFSRQQLSRMILVENAWLLMMGMGIGIGSALFTTLPHYVIGGANVPWIDLAMMFSVILIVGLVASWVTSGLIARMPLIDSLRC